MTLCSRHLLAAAAMLLVASSALGDPPLGAPQKIKQWGYEIKVPEEWRSAPQEPGEKWIVGSWKADGFQIYSLKGDPSYIGCEVKIVRIPITTLDTTELSPEAKEERERREREKSDTEKLADKLKAVTNVDKRMKPKNMLDYVDGYYEGAEKRWSAKDVKAGKLAGKFYEFTSGATAMAITVFRQDNIDWGIFYECSEEYYKKKWSATYLKSVQSFKLFPAQGQPDTLAPATDIRKLKGEQKRNAIKAGIAGLPGWYSIDTKNYVFLTNTTDKDLVTALSREIEVIREKVYTKLFPPRQPMDVICVARIFGTENDYRAYGGPLGTAGYWDDDKEELVLFDKFEGVTKKNSKEYTRSVMYHEAFHQYIYYAVGDVAPHSWFNEGHGDYFAGMSLGGGSPRANPFDWRVDFLKRHLTERKDLIPLKSLVRLPQSEYYTNGSLKYSQGWALIYYLRNVVKEKRIRDIPDIYFKHLADNVTAFRAKKKEEGKDAPSGPLEIEGIPGVKFVNFEDAEAVEKILNEAVDKAFDGIDFDKLDRDFQNWVKQL